MISLLTALLLTGPLERPALQRCVDACSLNDDVCWFELAPSCGPAGVCVDAPDRACKPLRVYLGTWSDPV